MVHNEAGAEVSSKPPRVADVDRRSVLVVDDDLPLRGMLPQYCGSTASRFIWPATEQKRNAHSPCTIPASFFSI
jgi:hypothetical protein